MSIVKLEIVDGSFSKFQFCQGVHKKVPLCREELGDLANQFVELDEIAVKQLSESQTDESE